MAKKKSALERISEQRLPVIALCMSCFVLWGFGYETVGLRLGIALNGVIIARQEIPRTPWTHGPGTAYTLRAPTGNTQEYVAGATDASLPRRLPIGAHLTKREWSLSYTLNGKEINDFPIVFYAEILAGAFAALIWSGYHLIRCVIVDPET